MFETETPSKWNFFKQFRSDHLEILKIFNKTFIFYLF